jgi:acetolactate synthase-1/2/3 large subunit
VKAAELLVKCLEEEGVEFVFGVPGEENADFVLALADSEAIRFVLTRHEQGAAFMAEVYGRLTGNPAVCLGTLGPGATNLVTGVADGNMDHAPMLVLTGQGATSRLHKESHQIMDVVRMFRPVTKWSTSLIRGDNVPEVVRKAVRVARSEKPGAVHIELPEDIAEAPTRARPLAVKRYRRPAPDPAAVEEAVARLRAARSPVIIAGNGCIRTRASASLRRFCERTGIGVLSTFMAKGAVDLDAPYCLFTIGLSQKDLPARAVDEADLVITLGFDMVEYHPHLWNPEGNKPIVHADFVPAEIDAHFQPDVELVGDLSATLDALTRALGNASLPAWDFATQAAVRATMLEEFARHADDDTEGTIRPQKALADLRAVLGPEDVVLSDVGAHKLWVARHYHCHEPNTCLIPNGFCSMGFALPGAVAACLVHPDRRIVAVCGDGGFLMNVQEMETAVRLGVSPTVLLWEDGGYGLISWKQEDEFGRSSPLAFGNPDWLRLAESFGWNGHRVERSRDLRGVLERAVAEDGPSLVVMPVDYRENPLLTKRLGRIEPRL